MGLGMKNYKLYCLAKKIAETRNLLLLPEFKKLYTEVTNKKLNFSLAEDWQEIKHILWLGAKQGWK